MAILVIVDMQNDFITGKLGSKEAQELLPKVIEFVKDFKGRIFYTMDEHSKDIDMDSIELTAFGDHCMKYTVGRKYPQELEVLLEKNHAKCCCKNSFMPEKYKRKDLWKEVDYAVTENQFDIQDIYVCGLCTNICVLNTALYLRNHLPYDKITVLKDLCAGTSKDLHEKALDVMESNLIEIKESREV